MAKFQSPLLGYNNNVRHRGRVFHIQTEDSGVNHPHIITHLFMDGGRILKSVKTSYAEHVGTEGMSETVRAMMKEQHKAMFIALRDGQFDGLVDPKKPSGSQTAVEPPKAQAAPEPTKTPEVALLKKPSQSEVVAVSPQIHVEPDAGPPTMPDPIPPAPRVPAVVLPPAAPAPVHAAVTAPPPEALRRATSPYGRATVPTPPPPSDGRLPPELEALLHEDPAEGPPTTRESVNELGDERRHKSVKELTLDFDSLGSDDGPSPIFQRSDLPPPPKNLFAKEPRTAPYRALDADAPAPERPSWRPPPPPPSKAPAAATKSPSDSRYAPARPAAIFGAAAKQASISIFSDELVSDKSLDEVILSYLAEDLDPPRRK